MFVSSANQNDVVAVALTVASAVAVAAIIDLKRFFRRFHGSTLVVLTGHALSNVVLSVEQLQIVLQIVWDKYVIHI